MKEDDEAQDPSENDGAGQDGLEEQHKTRIEARAYNQEVVVESHDASAQLADIAREQLEFQFKESRRCSEKFRTTAWPPTRKPTYSTVSRWD